jgi:hypothetical protein
MELKGADRSFLVCAVLGGVLTLFIWNLPWRFQVNDDEIMMWLVSGTYTGKPESFAVFIHPILSLCFAKLYTLAPELTWYPGCWFLTMFLGYLAYLRLIWSKTTGQFTALVWSLFALCLLVHFLFFLQFSIVSAFAISAGLACRFSRDSAERIRIVRIYDTDLLILIGFLIRPEVLVLFLAAYLVLNVLVVGNFVKVRLLIIPLLVLLLGYGVSHLWIKEANLQEFQRMNTLRSQVFDHPMLQLYLNEYKESEPELFYFANGLIDFERDADLVNKLEIWKVQLDGKRAEKLSADFLIRSLTYYLYHGRFFAVLMAAFVFFAFVLRGKQAAQILALLTFGLVLLSPFYLIKVQIYVLVFLVYFSSCLIISKERANKRVALIAVFVLVSAILAYHLYALTQSVQNVIPGDTIRQQLHDFHEEGIEEVYWVGAGTAYGEFYFDRPLNFKKLGWPTLLEACKSTRQTTGRTYLIHNDIYLEYRGYFGTATPRVTSIDGMILLIPNR